MTTTTTASDTGRSERLADRMLTAAAVGAELLAIELGRRLGLYEALFELGPTTASIFATEAAIDPRWASAWLEQQATAGMLDVVTPGDSTTREYLLPGAHMRVLLDSDDRFNVLGAVGLLAALGQALPDVMAAVGTDLGAVHIVGGPASAELAVATDPISRLQNAARLWGERFA